MTIVAQDIRETFPEFANVTDTLIDLWLAQAQRRINTTQWGAKADDATLWLAAHLLKIDAQIRSGGTAAAGPVSSHRVGDIAVTFAVPSTLGNSFLASTIYGQQYLELRRGIIGERVLNGTVSTDCCG